MRKRLAAVCVTTLLAVTLSLDGPGAAVGATPSGFVIVSAPMPAGAQSAQLRSVTALNPTHAWAAGSYVHGGRTDPLIEQWNGSGWKVVDSGYTLPASAALTGVSARGTKDVWAVGMRVVNPGEAPLVMHWNGSAWSVESTPLESHIETNNVAVAAVPGGAVWVGSGQSGEVADIERRVNGTWSIVTPPPIAGATAVQINDITATAADNVWFTGGAFISQHEVPVAYHWNGTTFTADINVLPPGVNQDIHATGIATTGSTSAVVVGGQMTPPGVQQPRSATWDGAAWRRWDLPPFDTTHLFSDVTALSANLAWAVGTRKSASGGLRTFIARLDGPPDHAAWTDLGGPNVAGVGNSLSGIGRVPGTASQMWAVGTAGGRPLVLHHP